MPETGTYIKNTASGESFRSFVPNPLPPHPPIELTDEDHELVARANLAIGRLDGATTVLPDMSLFLYFYIRKEAVLSSQIEGTQSSLSDMLLHEEDLAPGVPMDDVQEVCNYVAAMDHGLRRLREDHFPLSLRLIREMHKVLLSEGRGSDKMPGEFRRTQNWMGGTRPGNARFVPPPPDRLNECMDNLEKFLHDQPKRTSPLIKAALAHVQFETIHPFLDGNGRLGRLLITLILCVEGALHQPLLYLSLYFKENRQEYYDRLTAVRLDGDWIGWLRFFLKGVETTAQQAANTATRIVALFDENRAKIDVLGRKASSAHRLHALLQKHPITTINNAAKKLDLTAPTVQSAIDSLSSLNIVHEITGKKRSRIYSYEHYIDILKEGTDPLNPPQTTSE
jgi:Fic family protein